MAYSDIEPASLGTTHTDTEPLVNNTPISQIEPIGFGFAPFGDPSDNKEEKEYGRGFGDPTTKYTENSEA